MPVNSNLKTRMRQLLYMLKRQYPGSITVYKKTASDTDVRTGERTISATAIPVRRAIVMPVRLQRTSVQSISLISSNKEFVTGGTYDAGTRDFIIDRRDVKSLPDLNADDWIVYANKKYQIKTVETYEPDAGWIITAKELPGDIPEQQFFGKTDDLLVLESTAVAVVE